MAGNYKHDRLTYAAYVSMKARELSDPEQQQELRGRYYGKTGRKDRYLEYKAYCEENSYRYDDPPEWLLEELYPTYWWQHALGWMFALMGVWLWVGTGTTVKTVKRGSA